METINKIMPDIRNIPKELKALPQWVCWRLEQDKRSGRDCKVPNSPRDGHRASPNNPATWGTVEEAISCVEKYMFNGVGITFKEENGIIAGDIDNCIDENGHLNEIAIDILTKLPPTYVEISPSGKGIHFYIIGKLPKTGNRSGKTGVELYPTSRYFAFTGNKYQGSADFIGTDSGGIIDYIQNKYIVDSRKSKQSAKQSSFQPGTGLLDEELLRLAQASKDGEGFSALWNGEWQRKFKSQSEADFALCRKLAFWSARNTEQIDRLFRRSGLFREKWDVQHSAGGTTYGEQTVTNACKMTESVYSPPKTKKPSQIFEQGRCYYRRKDEKFYQITNFTVEPIEMIIADDTAQLTCDLVTDLGERFHQDLLSIDFSTVARLKNILNKNTIALSFMGGEGDLELFKIHIYALKWQKKRGVKATGIYPRDNKLVFVDTNGAVGVGGTKNTELVQMVRFQDIDSNILNADFITADGLRSLAEHILECNIHARTVPVLAWCAGCFIKPHLRRSGIKYPHLFLIGQGGSGKSNTLERIILPIFSRTKVVASSLVKV